MQNRTQGRELDDDDDLYSATKKMSRMMRERDDIKAEMHRMQACAAYCALATLSQPETEGEGGLREVERERDAMLVALKHHNRRFPLPVCHVLLMFGCRSEIL